MPFGQDEIPVRDSGSVTAPETVRRHASDPVSGPVTGRTDARSTHRTPFAHGNSALSDRHLDWLLLAPVAWSRAVREPQRRTHTAASSRDSQHEKGRVAMRLRGDMVALRDTLIVGERRGRAAAWNNIVTARKPA
ncbi:MAG: hypothetical protein RL385_2471 [Pseudomonadota bacterium]|jgi:hypothetical protein